MILGASLTGLFALFNQSFYWYGWITLVTGVGCLIVGGILVMAALLSLATRVKYGNGYWWRHSVTGFCLLMLGRGFLYLFRGLCSVFRMLPVIWKWVLTGAIAAVVTLACLNPVTSGVGDADCLGYVDLPHCVPPPGPWASCRRLPGIWPRESSRKSWTPPISTAPSARLPRI